MKKEIWKRISGFPKYQVSSFGRIRSFQSGEALILKTRKIDGGGYKYVKLYPGTITMKVHRLVAIAFHGMPSGLVVNHKDGNKLNNRADNLEWISQSDNHKHAYATGLRKPYDRRREGYVHPRVKLNKNDFKMMREWYATGEFSKATIARAFNVSESAVTYNLKLKKERSCFKDGQP